MSTGARLLALLDRGWAQLSDEEQETFEAWLRTAKPVDLYTLLRHTRRGSKSTSQINMTPVRRGPEET